MPTGCEFLSFNSVGVWPFYNEISGYTDVIMRCSQWSLIACIRHNYRLLSVVWQCLESALWLQFQWRLKHLTEGIMTVGDHRLLGSWSMCTQRPLINSLPTQNTNLQTDQMAAISLSEFRPFKEQWNSLPTQNTNLQTDQMAAISLSEFRPFKEHVNLTMEPILDMFARLITIMVALNIHLLGPSNFFPFYIKAEKKRTSWLLKAHLNMLYQIVKLKGKIFLLWTDQNISIIIQLFIKFFL